MEIQINVNGKYSDGQSFSFSCSDIETAIFELEMVEQNDHAFDKEEDLPLMDNGTYE